MFVKGAGVAPYTTVQHLNFMGLSPPNRIHVYMYVGAKWRKRETTGRSGYCRGRHSGKSANAESRPRSRPPSHARLPVAAECRP